jgi:TP901 family phage tail tape measure protein
MAQGNNQLQVNVVANVRAAQAEINKLAAKPVNLTINSKQFSQPLGRIQGQLGEFEKSLEASNARVIAFGASASAIYAVQKALSESVKSAIEIEKALTDINVILNLTDKSLAEFGTSLFDIAKNTGNAFSTVATAATELSRQGLGVAETLKRTQDALILTRLSGLGAADSVEAITATLNGFQKAALSSTDVINKLAAVDANFAVSSGDLAEAIKRVGSSAEDAGVSFDQLLAIVTSAQQITARGGSVIGNSFKTIFTRLQRPKVLEDLQQLGIQTQTAEGNTRPLIDILSELAKTFDVLNDSQKAAIAEQVGGVFQINILKAALGDLNKEYSIFSNALRTSTGATDEAIRRNEALNTTLASLINKTLANLTAAGAKIGELSLAPALKKVFGGLNTVLEGFSGGDSEDFGSKIGEGLLKGIGNFLSGPGIIIATKALFSIFERLTVFSADAIKTLLGLNVQATQQAQIQQQINALLSQNPAIIAQIVSGQTTLQDIQDNILNTIKAQTLAMEQQVTVSKALAASLGAAGVSIGTTGAMKGRLQAKAGGYMPSAFRQEEASARSLGAVNPKAQLSKGTIGGEKFIKNNKEIEIPNFGKNGDSAVIPTYGSVGDKRQKEYYDKLKFLGFVPNFAGGQSVGIQAHKEGVKREDLGKYLNNFPLTKEQQNIAIVAFDQKSKTPTGTKTIEASNTAIISATGQRKSVMEANYNSDLNNPPNPLKTRFVGIHGIVPKNLTGDDFTKFDALIEKHLPQAMIGIANELSSKVSPSGGYPNKNKIAESIRSDTSGYPQIAGRIFEVAIQTAINKQLQIEKSQGDKGNRTWDFGPDDFGLQAEVTRAIFGDDQAAILMSTPYIDAKRSPVGSKDTNASLKSKFFNTPYFQQKIKSAKAMARGYIPNFAGIRTAIQAEKKMGGNPALDFQEGVGLYVRDKSTQPNFAAVKRDHPEGIGQAMKNSQKAQESLARGFIPNFATTSGAQGFQIGDFNAALGSLKKTLSDKELPQALQSFKQNIFLTSFAFSTLDGLVESFNKDGKNAFGNILSGVSKGASTFTALAGVIPGQAGLIVGAVAGFVQAVDSVAESFENASIDEIIKQSGQTSEDFSKLSDASQKYATAFQKLEDIYKSNAPYKEVNKAEKDLYESLQNIPSEYRNLFASAKTLTEVQDAVGKSLSKKGEQKQGADLAKALAENTKQNRSNLFARYGRSIIGEQSNQGIYTRNKEGFDVATEEAGQITKKLSEKFFIDFQNGLIDTTQNGYNFIKMLKQYGLDADSAKILTERLNNEQQDGANQTKILKDAIYEETAARIQSERKYKEGQKNREASQADEAEQIKIQRRLTAEIENTAAISEMYSNALNRTALQEKKLIDIRRSAQSEIISETLKSGLQTAQPFLSETGMARSQYQIEAFQRTSNLQTKQSDIMASAIEQMSTDLSESIQGEINKLRSENAPKSKIQELQNRKAEIGDIVRQGESPAQIGQALQQLSQELALDDQAILAQKANEILANIQSDQQNALIEYQKGNTIAQEQLRAQLTQIQDQQRLKVAGGVQGFLDPNSFQTTFDNFTKNLNLYRGAGSRSVIERGRGATGLLSDTLNFAGGGLPIGTGGGLGGLRSEAIAGRAADIRNQSRTLGAKAPIGLRPVFRDISANASEIAAKQIDNLIKDQNIGDNVDKIATTLQQIQTSLTPNLGPTSNATQSFVNQRNSAATNIASTLQPLKGSVDLNIPNNLLALNVDGKISVEGGNVEVTLSPDSDLTALVTPIINNFMNIAKQDIKNEFNNRILKLREEAGLRREATAV